MFRYIFCRKIVDILAEKNVLNVSMKNKWINYKRVFWLFVHVWNGCILYMLYMYVIWLYYYWPWHAQGYHTYSPNLSPARQVLLQLKGHCPLLELSPLVFLQVSSDLFEQMGIHVALIIYGGWECCKDGFPVKLIHITLAIQVMSKKCRGLL